MSTIIIIAIIFMAVIFIIPSIQKSILNSNLDDSNNRFKNELSILLKSMNLDFGKSMGHMFDVRYQYSADSDNVAMINCIENGICIGKDWYTLKGSGKLEYMGIISREKIIELNSHYLDFQRDTYKSDEEYKNALEREVREYFGDGLFKLTGRQAPKGGLGS